MQRNRGRPVIHQGTPPDFSAIIAEDCDAYGTAANNRMHARNFTRFLVHVCGKLVNDTSGETTWQAATYENFREYARSLAFAGAGLQVWRNYTTNVRKYLGYKGMITATEMSQKWEPVDKERTERLAVKNDGRQAPVMTCERFRGLARSTRSTFTLLLTLGLRGDSLMKLKDSDYCQTAGQLALNVCNYKIMPDEDHRVITIPCACEKNAPVNCPIHNEAARPSLTNINWGTMTYELQRSAATWHSAKRTAAVMLKILVVAGIIEEDEKKLCRFLGHTFSSGNTDRTKMFKRYARGWEHFTPQLLPPLWGAVTKRYKQC